MFMPRPRIVRTWSADGACPVCRYPNDPAPGWWTMSICSGRACWSHLCCMKTQPDATFISRPEPGLITKRVNHTTAVGIISKLGQLPVVMLVRDGTVIPINLAQSTQDMDWSHLELVVFAKAARNCDRLGLPARRIMMLHELSPDQGRQHIQTEDRSAGGQSDLENNAG